MGNPLFTATTPPPFAWQPNPAHNAKAADAEDAWLAIYHEIAHAEAAHRHGVKFSCVRIGKKRTSELRDFEFSGNLAADLEIAAAGAACTLVLTDGRNGWDRDRAKSTAHVDRNALWAHYKDTCGKDHDTFMSDFCAEVDRLEAKLHGDATLRGQYDAWAKRIGDEFWDRLEAPHEGHVDFEWPSLSVLGSDPP